MGAGLSKEEIQRRIEKSNKFKAALLLKVMKYDFNFDCPEVDSTIQSGFTIDNTNDLGETFLPHTAHIVEMEFRKFMYLNFLSILKPTK